MGYKTFFTGVRFSQIAVTAAILRQFDAEAAGKYLGETLGSIPGIPSKFQQFLSFKSGHSGARPAPMPLVQVKDLIERSVPRLAEDLLEISPVAETASLGQVHMGRLKDDRIVAIKVMYPRVKDRLSDQLKVLIQAARRSPAAQYAFDADSYEKVLHRHFERETDYLSEATEQERFAARLSTVEGLVIPKVYREYSSENVLTQSYEESTRLRDLAKLDLASRTRCAEILTRTFSRSLFQHGLLHADLQPANWGFRPEAGEVVLYDFGAVLELAPVEVSQIQRLIMLCRAAEPMNDSTPWIQALIGLGFDQKKLQFISDELPKVCCETFESMIRVTQNSAASSVSMGEKIDEALGPRKWWLRTAGPPRFFLLLRSVSFFFQTLESLNLSSVENLKSIFDLETSAFEKPGTDASLRISPSLNSNLLSKHLNVLISQNGEEIVSLQLPAQAVDDLESFISKEVEQKAGEAGYSIAKIKEEVRMSRYSPRELVALSIGDKKYRVWLD